MHAAAICKHVRRISQYVEYVEGLEPVEEAEPACVDGRLQLEKAWQVVANEYFDPHGSFSQAAWAQQLHQTLQVRALAQ